MSATHSKRKNGAAKGQATPLHVAQYYPGHYCIEGFGPEERLAKITVTPSGVTIKVAAVGAGVVEVYIPTLHQMDRLAHAIGIASNLFASAHANSHIEEAMGRSDDETAPYAR